MNFDVTFEILGNYLIGLQSNCRTCSVLLLPLLASGKHRRATNTDPAVFLFLLLLLLTGDLTVFRTRDILYQFNAGWLYNEAVDATWRSVVDRQLLGLRIKGKVRHPFPVLCLRAWRVARVCRHIWLSGLHLVLTSPSPALPRTTTKKHTHTQIRAIVEEAVGDLRCEAANETDIGPLIILVPLGLFVLPPLVASIAVIACWRTRNDGGRDLETGEELVARDAPDLALGPAASKGSLLDSGSEDALHAAAGGPLRRARNGEGG